MAGQHGPPRRRCRRDGGGALTSRPTCLLSGGTAELVEALATALPELELVREGVATARELASQASGWVHAVPSEATQARQVDLFSWAVDEAFEALPAARNPCFLALIPVDGLVEGADALECEIAAASARSAVRRLVEPWSRRGLRLNIVEYGAIESLPTAARRSGAALTRRTPMARAGTVRELACAIAFLLSGAASYVTGATLRVDGGWGAYSWFYPVRTI